MQLCNQFCRFSKKNGAYVIKNMFRNITALFCRQLCNKIFLTAKGIILFFLQDELFVITVLKDILELSP